MADGLGMQCPEDKLHSNSRLLLYVCSLIAGKQHWCVEMSRPGHPADRYSAAWSDQKK